MSATALKLGVGQVRHERHGVAARAFTYPTFFLMLPMRHWARAPGGLARNRWAPLAFWDRDHGDGRGDSLAWLDQLLHGEGIVDADGEVWLQCYPRVWGHTFKPVSFWFAHRSDGQLRAIVAEVNNTFGERHCYLLAQPDMRWGQPLTASKVFHVSPFFPVEGRYEFHFMRTDLKQATGPLSGPDRYVARVDLHGPEGLRLSTSISGELVDATPGRLRGASWRWAALTLGVLWRIHRQAWSLWRGGATFFRKPTAPREFVTR